MQYDISLIELFSTLVFAVGVLGLGVQLSRQFLDEVTATDSEV